MDASYFEFCYWSLSFGIAMVQLEQLGTIKVSFYAFMLARTEYSYRILMSYTSTEYFHRHIIVINDIPAY